MCEIVDCIGLAQNVSVVGSCDTAMNIWVP